MPKKGRWAEHPELLKERSQDGVIRALTLESLGMNSNVIYRRCLPAGPWQRLLPGIILLHNTEPTQRERLIAALLYCGPQALVTGAAACRLYGLRVPTEFPDAEIHVLVPHERKILSSEFVTVERTARMPGAWIREGLPLAPLVRATTDAVRRVRAEEPVGSLLVQAIQRGRCPPDAIKAELDIGTKRGTALPRRLLAEWVDLRSVAEARARQLSRQLAEAPTHWNPMICDAGGHYVGRPDGWWEDVALAWEIDSVDFHFYRDDYAKTLHRNNRYAATGIVVVQTLPSQLEKDPARVLADLKSAHQEAKARPRPAVFLTPEAA